MPNITRSVVRLNVAAHTNSAVSSKQWPEFVSDVAQLNEIGKHWKTATRENTKVPITVIQVTTFKPSSRREAEKIRR